MSTPDRPPKERALVPKTVAALAVAFLLIAFGLANRNDVPINWLVGTTSTPARASSCPMSSTARDPSASRGDGSGATIVVRRSIDMSVARSVMNTASS